MNLTQLQYFYEVCRWQNITKASSYLHVSQPTVSLSMRDLEEKTGLNLFRREGKHIIITEDGMALYRKIIPILKSMDDLNNTVQRMVQMKNHIRIAIPLQIGTTLLPAIMKKFRHEYSEITLEVSEAGGIDALRMLENDELDLAITNYDPNFSDNLTYIRIDDIECCFVTYPEHKFADRKSITWEEVATEPLVLLNGGFFVNSLIEKYFVENSLEPNILLYTPQLHTVKNLVTEELASTVLTRQAILPRDNLVSIPFSNSVRIKSGIVMKKGHHLYTDEHLLIDFIKNNFPRY